MEFIVYVHTLHKRIFEAHLVDAHPRGSLTIDYLLAPF